MTSRVGDSPRVSPNSTIRTDNTVPTNVQGTSTSQPATNTGWAPGTNGARRTTGVEGAHRVEESLPPRPQRLTGRMEMDENGGNWRMRLANGQTVDLVASEKGTRLSNSNQPMNPTWARGFINDNIDLTVRGQLGADGKFQVEDFSPGNSDKYVSGRVQMRLNGETVPRGDPRAAQATVFINTARGDVEIRDPQLAEKFRLAGPLGVILPGDPKMENGKLVYDAAPSQYFALGRPQTPSGASNVNATRNDDGTFTTQHAMAYHGFNGRTVLTDENAAARVNHMDRNWLLGDFVLGQGDKAGQLTEFRASYVSGPAGTQSAPMASAQTVPDTRLGDAAAQAQARQQLQQLTAANPTLANVERVVTNQSWHSPPVDFGAFNLRNGAPRPPQQ